MKDPDAVALGRKGGLKGGMARAAKMTPAERSESARRAAEVRWSGRVALVVLTREEADDISEMLLNWSWRHPMYEEDAERAMRWLRREQLSPSSEIRFPRQLWECQRCGVRTSTEPVEIPYELLFRCPGCDAYDWLALPHRAERSPSVERTE